MLAVELGMEADTWRRYENGQTEMRVNQVRPFARAFGVPAHELIEALLPVEDDALDLAATLEAADMPPDEIKRVLGDCADWGEDDQRDYVLEHAARWRRLERTRRRDASA
jgi:transcriptional regulator with XRE-family HTH domain